MPWRIPDGLLDNTHTWNNRNDEVEYLRAFTEQGREAQLTAQAMVLASPNMDKQEIRTKMTALPPPRFGYAEHGITIDDCFGLPADPNLNSSPPTDFSGTNGGYTGTDYPANKFF